MQSEHGTAVNFTVYQPNVAPVKISLQPQTITLGRASDCTIPIRDRFLSRKHAEIIYSDGEWFVRDCGSVNGTMLNGARLTGMCALRPGDRIILGDSEVVFHSTRRHSESQLIQVDSDSQAKNIAIPIRQAIDDINRGRERTGVLASLAIQFIEDRPMSDLFDFILDRVMEVLEPSRAALALLAADKKTFATVKLRRRDDTDSPDLTISRTLLAEVVEERNVVSFVDTGQDEKLARAASIVAQQIRGAVCAPLLVGDDVLGVLYLDFLASRGSITQEDIRLVAQIARFAAVKLETTRLREEALAMAKIEEELRTAYVIQSRLLPTSLPVVPGYSFAGTNKPCKTVSGDYYDIVVRPDGRIYFVIADVSGKGVTAALVMSGLATAFNIFTRTDPAPADLVRQLNLTLTPKTAPARFATLVAGVLDPGTGAVQYANAGHVAPLIVSRSGVTPLTTTDLVVGLFEQASYRNQNVTLDRGDVLVLFTDGVTEAENAAESQLGIASIVTLLESMHGAHAEDILNTIDMSVHDFCEGMPMMDDLTVLAVARTSQATGAQSPEHGAQ